MMIGTKGGSLLEIIGLILLFLIILIKVGPAMIVPIAFAWLAALVLNPPIPSAAVWFIAVLYAYVFPIDATE